MSVAISWANEIQLAKCDIIVGFPISSHIWHTYVCVCVCCLCLHIIACMSQVVIYIPRDVQILSCLDSCNCMGIHTGMYACTHTHTYIHTRTHTFSTSSEGNTREANALLNIVENSYRTMVTVISHICNDTPNNGHTLSNPPIPI